MRRGRTGLRVITAIVLGIVGSATNCQAHDPTLSSIRILFRSHDILLTVSGSISQLRTAERQGEIKMTHAAIENFVRHRVVRAAKGLRKLPPTSMLDVNEATDVFIWQTVFHRKRTEFTIVSALFAELPDAKTVVAEIVPDGPASVVVLYSKAKSPSG